MNGTHTQSKGERELEEKIKYAKRMAKVALVVR